MTFASGTRLGPYEIVAEIGAGGMGVVYRARDARLGRDVAIKVLPAAVATDPDRLQRFEQEARAVAALTHPNILAVYDIGSQATDPSASPLAGPTPYIVSELLDGESLGARIADGPVPARKALDYAVQIAHGLAAAHDRGIVHRDLKPDNVFVGTEGRVKILDFGLAKLTQAEPVLAGASALPTAGQPPPNTMPGMVLGTLGYMAPEQVRGMAADHRADIFALGVVLYETLAGRRAFTGETTADVMSAILRADPPEIDPALHVPPALARIIARCLEKHPGSRFQSARDLAFALEGLSTHSGEQTALATPAATSWRGRVGWMAAAIALVLAGAAGQWVVARPETPALLRLSIVLPPDNPVTFGWTPGHSLAISADATMVAYVGASLDVPTSDRRGQLFARSLDSVSVRALPGTDNARQPFFSADGGWVAFFGSTDGIDFSLKKVALAGGNPITVLDTIAGGQWASGVWLDDDTIVIGGTSTGLRRINADGGTPEPLTTLSEGEVTHLRPAVLPDGRHVLFQVAVGALVGTSRIEAVSLETGMRRVVIENAGHPVYLSSGHLLFQREDQILAAPFDASRIALTGSPVPLVDDIRRDGGPFQPGRTPQLAVSSGGTLAYVPGGGQSDGTLGLVARDGRFEAIGRRDRFSHPRVSPDGRTLAVSVGRGLAQEVLLVDTMRGTTTRLTRDGSDATPAWRPPDGRALALSSIRGDTRGIVLKELDGAERFLAQASGPVFLRNMSWTPDGRQLVYTRQDTGGHDIWLLTIDGPSPPQPLLENPWSEHSPRVSPDGRWLAYVSDESGRQEIWVQRFPRGERRRVSENGGQGPVWSRDGRQLYFQGPHESAPGLMTVAVESGGEELRLGDPAPLLEMRVTGPTGVVEQYGLSNNVGPMFDVLPDGRFVMVRGADPLGTREIVLVQQFGEEARRLVTSR